MLQLLIIISRGKWATLACAALSETEHKAMGKRHWKKPLTAALGSPNAVSRIAYVSDNSLMTDSETPSQIRLDNEEGRITETRRRLREITDVGLCSRHSELSTTRTTYS